ncbi:hypothetical protein ACRAWF_33005 [Streptomyces sp. L7]
MTILREGHVVRTRPAREETPATLVEGMLGRSLRVRLPAEARSPPRTRLSSSTWRG